MELTIITLTLLGITVASFLVGSVWLAKYAFRLGAGQGIGVLLFPPYTFYFAFYQLDNDAKDRPTALWMFGLVASLLLVAIFTSALRVPSFVDPTPADQEFIAFDAGKEVTFTAAVFDLDSQGSVFMKIPTLENYQGATFAPGANGYDFKWKTSFENAGEYQLPLEASDGTNTISRTIRLKLTCAEDCKAAKAAKAAAAAKAAEEAARKAEEERKAAEAAAAANGTTPNGTTPNGTTPNGAANGTTPPANNQ